MKNTLLGKALLYQPSSTEYENLRSWYIVNCVFNAFLTITAIIFNSVTIQALRKTSSLPKPLRALLLSLAISDLGVGLLGEPFYFGLLVKWLQRDNSTDAASTAFLFTLYLFSAASFSGVMALSGDRFLAVHLHLRYQELVTHKRVVVVVISIWLFSALFSLFCLRVSTDISQALVPIIGVVCLVFSAVLYYEIYLAVRRHRNQIHAALQVQQVAQNGEMANADRLKKSAVGTFYVYLVFLLCNFPQFCIFAVVEISGLNTGVKVLFIFSTTLLFVNSTLNPVIYCWKMRHIRRAVLDILRNIFPSHN